MSSPASEITAARVTGVRYGHKQGWSFTPLKGKVPTQKGWQKEPRATMEQAVAWAESGNVGLRTGAASGIIVIDVDEGGDVTALDLPQTVTVKTGRGGLHYYFRHASGLRNSVGKLGPHIDTRCDGGQVVYPGSVHPETGTPYQWVEGCEPWAVEVAELPQHVFEQFASREKPSKTTAPQSRGPATGTNYGVTALRRECESVRAAAAGTRNDTLNKAAMNLGQLVGAGQLSQTEVEKALRSAAEAAGLEPHEITATMRSGLDAGIAKPRAVKPCPATRPPAADAVIRHAQPPIDNDTDNLTDLANAARLVAKHGSDLRFCGLWGKWLVWDGNRWRPDDSLEVMRRAKATALRIWSEARDAPPDRQKAIAAFAHRSQARDRLAAMIDLARCELALTPEALDADALKLNVLNGTIDLRTGLLKPHSPGDLITKLAPVAFDPAAQCPTWNRFLLEIMGNDDALIGYLQRLTGYCLTADATEQALFIFYGSGSNGKNVFLDTLTSLLGDYAGTAPPSLLMLRRNPEHPTELADLMGRRLVVASETEEGGRLNVNLVKQLTGNARLKGRFMRQDYFDFERTFKLVLMTNHLPVIGETTHAAWRRLRLVPFAVTIPDNKQDRHLIDKLKADWPGILAWAVRGCLEWQKAGLQTPEAVQNVTNTYREDSNPLADFVAECCLLTPNATVSRSDIFDAYQKWAERNHDRNPLERTALFERLRGLSGVSDDRRRQGGKPTRGFSGIGLCFSREHCHEARGE